MTPTTTTIKLPNKMRLLIHDNYDQLSRWVANYIVGRIKNHQEKSSKSFVLGLPTGSSPLGTYRELIKLNHSGEVSFENVITFNMDEYVGLEESHPESYHSFMYSNFFSQIGIPEENINILNGNAEDLEAQCLRYEEKIKAVGGIDLFLGGIGVDGHIAFNEPGSSLSSRTRVKTLNTETRMVNSRFFENDINKVPKLALTVGVGTVMDAREVVIIVNGHQKARALHMAVEAGVSHMWTITALQLHHKSMIVCDEGAADELKVSTYKYFKDIEKANIDPTFASQSHQYLY
jgi:glucosamine-6-phosphate deaminase